MQILWQPPRMRAAAGSRRVSILIGSNALSSGMLGAVLLKTMLRSYLNFLPGFHWPPTSGVVQTFFTGLVGPPFQVIGPTSDW